MDLPLRRLTREAFRPFGQVIQKEGAATNTVNGGTCLTYSDLADIDHPGARTTLHIQVPQPYAFPIEIAMLERHPLGSQAFIPLTDKPFLVIVAEDTPAGPSTPVAFLTQPGQGINLGRGVWHHMLTAIHEGSEFLAVDRKGEGVNFERVDFERPYVIRNGEPAE